MDRVPQRGLKADLGQQLSCIICMLPVLGCCMLPVSGSLPIGMGLRDASTVLGAAKYSLVEMQMVICDSVGMTWCICRH